MASKPTILVPSVPVIETCEGMFYVDFQIERVPHLAFSPHVWLRSVVRAHRCYAGFAEANGCTVASLREMLVAPH